MWSPLWWGWILAANKSTYSDGSLIMIIVRNGIPINHAYKDFLK